MQTRHTLHFADAATMAAIASESVDLVVTSPPYPMIAMWDEHFCSLDPEIAAALQRNRGGPAFERMHAILDKVWLETVRILKPGGIACINIGDAVRTLDGRFELYANHSRVLSRMIALGLSALPLILWRKPTNAPTKFMGSGMLPPSAYVTLEHEYILILRKGDRRRFSDPEDRRRRQASAFFWEERNRWFSDMWLDLRGTGQRQNIQSLRQRSAAFPFELPFRLILMFSVYEDTVVDPFCGTGTTLLAAMAAGRNSIGFELDPGFEYALSTGAAALPALAAERIGQRIADHRHFLEERQQAGFGFRHRNQPHGFAVMTAQETRMQLRIPATVQHTPGKSPDYRVEYRDLEDALSFEIPASDRISAAPRARQRNLFS